jgi:hypothetical protein
VSKIEYKLARALADIQIRKCNIPTLDPATEELDVKEHKAETEV